MKTIRVLIVEGNRVLREGLASMLRAEADLKVVASSGGNEETLQQVRRFRPNVVLLDLGLRNLTGVRLVAALTGGFPGVSVIGMGLMPSQVDIVELVEAGASGFILKDARAEDCLGAIRSVAAGTRVLPPSLAGTLFSHVIERALRKGKGNLTRAVRMTGRERQVVALIAEGRSNKEIAQELSIATYTVKSHVHNILEKLALHSRLEIASSQIASP